MTANTLVVGGDGFVARQLLRRLEELGRPALVTSRRPDAAGLCLDLADPDVDIFQRHSFGTAVLLAAQTKMQLCQDRPDETRLINVVGTLKVARALAETGARIVFVSSAQVYGGDVELPDEETGLTPKNVYGAQKLAAEQALLEAGLEVLILRPPRLVSTTPVGMFAGWCKDLSDGKPIVAAENIHLSPVAVDDFVGALITLNDHQATGCYNVSSPDQIRYIEAARMMADHCGFDVSLVRGERLAEDRVPAIFRPKYTALDCAKIAREFGLTFPPVRDVLARTFRSIGSRP